VATPLECGSLLPLSYHIAISLQRQPGLAFCAKPSCRTPWRPSGAKEGRTMKNPIGPYPGRQLFTGLTSKGTPCLAYLVTGRSPESRARKATLSGDKVIIGPIGTTEYDPLRHYTAIQFNSSTGIAVISNGIQTEAVFETYRLLYNVDSVPAKEYLEKILEGAQAEPDSLHTPRISAVITEDRVNGPVSLIGIKRHDRPATVFQVKPEHGLLTGISVYNGTLDNPAPFDPTPGLPQIKIEASSPDAVAQYLFEISSADEKSKDLVVCAVGGIRSGKNWDLAIINASKDR
jgi:IMP cyclohydrolase